MIGIYKFTNKINGHSYIGQSIDIEKLNENVPVLYYPTGKTFVITKADVIKFLNENFLMGKDFRKECISRISN